MVLFPLNPTGAANDQGTARGLFKAGQENVMTRMSKAGLAAVLACSLLPSAALSQSQRACPEGRTASGQCVNPQLADSMRQDAIIYSQPKLSYTHYPVLPVLDWVFRWPNQLNPDPTPPSAAGTSGSR